MSENPNDFTKFAQNLVTHTISEQVRAAQRYYDLAMRYGKGELSPQALVDESVKFASQETGRYASDIAMLGLHYYNEWFAINQRYSNRFLEVLGSKPVTQVNRAAKDVSSVTSAPKRVDIDLHGPLGQEVVRSFVLENKRAETAFISFDISDFSSPAGTAAFRAPLQVEPAQFNLGAGQENTVNLRLMLQAGLFTPGQRYFGTVVVRGYDGLELKLTVWADVPDPITPKFCPPSPFTRGSAAQTQPEQAILANA